MTTIVQSSAPPATSGQLGRLVRGFGIWASAAAMHWERRAATKALSAMSDRELRDIGLMRCDIESAVSGSFDREMGRP